MVLPCHVALDVHSPYGLDSALDRVHQVIYAYSSATSAGWHCMFFDVPMFQFCKAGACFMFLCHICQQGWAGIRTSCLFQGTLKVKTLQCMDYWSPFHPKPQAETCFCSHHCCPADWLPPAVQPVPAAAGCLELEFPCTVCGTQAVALPGQSSSIFHGARPCHALQCSVCRDRAL